jgi:hypothetical protein
MDRLEGKTAQPSPFTKKTPMELSIALAELVKRCRPVDFPLLNAGMVPGKKRAHTAAAIEASQAPLIGQH